MYALFAGACEDPESGIPGGIDDLRAVTATLEEATGRLGPLLESDSALDWAHVVDLTDPKLRKVAEWDNGAWHATGELPSLLAV